MRCKSTRRAKAEGAIIQLSTPTPASSKAKLLQKFQPRNKAVELAKKCESATYAPIIKQSTAQINITDQQVEISQTCFTKKRGMLFELKGESANVDNFAKKLEAVIKEKADVRIPQKTTSILLIVIDDSMEQNDITRTIPHPTLQDTALK